jgi:hypothetical protein
MFNYNIHVIFLSRSVIFTNLFLGYPGYPRKQPARTATPFLKNVSLEGTRLEVIQQHKTKEANLGVVYTTTKQLKENAARKRSALSKKNTQVLCETFYLSLL